VDSKSHRGGKYPTESSSLWPGVVKAKDIAKRFIQLMRSRCPTLQYVQMQRWAWQITAPLSGVPVLEADADSQVELRELEREERKEIELFATDSFVANSGLPGPEDFHEQLSEEQQLRFERMLAEVEARIAAGDPELVGFID